MGRPRGHRGQSEPQPSARPCRSRTPEPRRGGPIDDALHTVGKVAGTGVRIADGLAREVLRRVPRP